MIRVILIFIMILFVSGCGKSDYVVAKVNRHVITISDVEDRISRLPIRYRSVAKENKADFVDEMVVDLLLYDEAVKRGLLSDRDLRKVIEEAQKKIVIAKLIKDEVEDKIKISNQEIEEYYRSSKDEFMAQPKYRASHILVSSEEEAKALQDKLKKNGKFEDLARDYSKDMTAKRGGDIGYFMKGEVIPEFENVCLNLNVGETSPIIKTQFGYHIIKLTDRVTAQPKSLDEVKEDIRNIIKTKKRQELFNKLVSSLKTNSKIKVDDEILKSIRMTGSKQN